MESDLRYFRTT